MSQLRTLKILTCNCQPVTVNKTNVILLKKYYCLTTGEGNDISSLENVKFHRFSTLYTLDVSQGGRQKEMSKLL